MHMLQPVMHDSDSGIGIDSGISPIFAGIGTRIGITDFKRYWKLEPESESENVVLESESESRILKLIKSLSLNFWKYLNSAIVLGMLNEHPPITLPNRINEENLVGKSFNSWIACTLLGYQNCEKNVIKAECLLYLTPFVNWAIANSQAGSEGFFFFF